MLYLQMNKVHLQSLGAQPLKLTPIGVEGDKKND